MILTTSGNIEGQEIVMYKDIVFGEAIHGVNFMRDFGAGVRNIFGGRARGYEKDLIQARQEALNELEERAEELGANAVVAISFDYQVLGDENNMLMVTSQGTAVIAK